jgi:WD40 repeat protein/predicted Ser/Thr protein kinase
MSEQWQRIDRLLDQALELRPRERGAFLDRACADDLELRREAESLLAASDQAANFLDSPALPALDTSDDQAASLTGQAFGPYCLSREIGRGGMGVVYLAARFDDEFQKQVAVKLVQSGPRNKDLLLRFRRERQILANLEHPNIARLLDGGTTAQGQPFLVMEYVEGTPLTEYCDEHRLSIPDRLKLFRSVCEAVQYAHQNLVIHRDLKPSNILVTAEGSVKLLDFGVAKLLDGDSGFAAATTIGQLMTPEYASPEQIRGEPVTTASDVYSLGIVLYELLSGRYPYRFKDRSLREMMRVICEQEPEPPSRAISRAETLTSPDGAVPPLISAETVSRARQGNPEQLRARLRGDLNYITLMALRKAPAERYRTVERFSEDIARHLQDRPVIARKPTPAYRARKFIGRHKTLVAAVAILVLILLGGAFSTMRQASLAKRQVRETRRLLYAAEMHLASQAWENANMPRLRELVEIQIPHDGEEDLRGFEWYYLWRLYHHNGEICSLQHEAQVWTTAFSPDGRWLATGDDAGQLTLWDAATHQQLAVVKAHEEFIWQVVFSPDGRKLATASGDWTVKLWDAATLRETATLRGHTGKVRAVAFLPDGKRLASGGDDATARFWDVETGQQLMKIDTDGLFVRSLAISPDGRTIATGAALWDAITGKKLRDFFRGPGFAVSVKFSPDGRRLAFPFGTGAVSLRDISSGQEIALFKGHTSLVHSVAFSPDGKMLAIGSQDRTVRMWDVAGKTEINVLKGHKGEIWSVAFSPDSRTLATSSDDFTARLWDLTAGSEITRLATDHRAMVAFSPDGLKLAAAGWGLIARVWDAGDGRQLAALEAGAQQWSVAFAPDGERLAIGDKLGNVKLWDIATQKLVLAIQAHSDIVASVSFSPDGRTLATASRDHTAKLWDLATGQRVLVLTGHPDLVTTVAFSPDGGTLATASYDNTVKLWEARTGRELATLRGHTQPVFSVAFSPDGKILATGSTDSTAKVWDAITGRALATLGGHAGHVNSVAFSPDGKRLATAGDEGVVRLWDVATNQEIIALPGHPDSIASLAFSPDGTMLAGGSGDGTVQVWRADAP